MEKVILAKTKRTLKKGELTRQDLLAAGRAVFARVGYSGAEIVRIAREAGKSIGVFYIYFENKDDLLKCLVEEFQTELHQALPGPLNAPEQFATVMAKLWVIYRRHASTFLALTEAAVTVPVFWNVNQRLRNFARNDFSGMVRERQRQGFCQGVDPACAGAALETMVNYCLYEWLARGTKDFEDDADGRVALATLSGIASAVLQLDGVSSPR